MSASKNKIVPTLLLGLSFVIASGFSPGIHAQDIAPKVDEYMNAAVRVHRFSGTILLARDGRPVVNRGYGMANFELNVANTPKTKFRIGSMTKQFTAMSVLILQERGKLSDRFHLQIHSSMPATMAGNYNSATNDAHLRHP